MAVQPLSITSSTSSTGPSTPARSGTVKPSHTAASRCAEFADGSGRGPTGSAVPSSGSRPISAIRRARCASWCGRVRDPTPTTPTGRAAHGQPASTLTQASSTSGGTGTSSPRDELAQPRAPADVGQPPDHPALVGELARRDPARRGHAQLGHAGRPLLARRHRDPGPADPLLGRGLRRRRRPTGTRRCPCRCRSARTAARSRRRAGGAGTPAGTPGCRGRRASPAARPRGRWRSAGAARRRRPTAAPVATQPPFTRCTAPSLSRTFSSISSRVRDRSTRVSIAAVDSGAVRQHLQGPAHERLGREGERGEVGPDVAVLRARQEHHLRPLDRAPGPADLLVVGDRRGRRAEVHDEPEVRLVEPHAQRARGDQRLDPVRQQVRLRGQPLLRIGLAGVGRDREPALAQELGDLLRGGDR